MIHIQNQFYDVTLTPKEALLCSCNLSPSHSSLSSRGLEVLCAYHPNDSPAWTREQLSENLAFSVLFFQSITFLVTNGFWTVAMSFQDLQPPPLPPGAFILDSPSFTKATSKETLVACREETWMLWGTGSRTGTAIRNTWGSCETTLLGPTPRISDPVGVGWGQRTHISIKSLGDAQRDQTLRTTVLSITQPDRG